MLIPNKFNGYSRDGIRKYNIGGGVGEAMLLGAAVGGGSAAITGGDPLKGALLGGLTGGVGGGISTALAPEAVLATEAATQAGTQAATQAGTQAATQAATQAGTQAATQAGTQAATSAFPGMGGQTAAQQFMSSVNPAAIAPTGIPGGTIAPGVGSFAPAGGGISSLPTTGGTFTEGMSRFASDPMASIKANPFTAGAAGLTGAMYAREGIEAPEEYDGPLKRFRFNPETYRSARGYAEGGITALASGGYDRMVGEEPMYPSNMASGGISNLGTYSDGGRMLKGPGDGMSDSIPGVIGGKRPARLADGEFVVPADVVSHLGNGSTDAGAKHLYSMMDKVRKARTGRKAQGREINPRKYVPA
jgi:hypothetical protein